jgi:enoyl-CoA hydratase
MSEDQHRDGARSSGAEAAVLVERRGGVATLTLNRPDRLNALDAAATIELTAAIRETERDDSTRVVVITGAGRAFCAGGDIRGMGAVQGAERVGHRDIDLHRALLDLTKPILAYVNGTAVGLGFSLALACDVTIAADDALVGDPHVALGLVAGDGAIVPLTLTLGPARAKEMLLRADLIKAQEACERGILHHCYPRAEAKHRTDALAQRLAENPAPSVAALKRLLNRRVAWATRTLLEPALAAERRSMQMPEYPEAVRRFKQRRTRGEP